MSAQITVPVAGSERSVRGADHRRRAVRGRPRRRRRPGQRRAARPRPRARRRRRRRAGDRRPSRTASTCCGTRPRTCSPRRCRRCNPEARLGIGPPIRDGFYYDFDVETPFTPEDLKALEKVMQRIVNEGQTFAPPRGLRRRRPRRARRRALQVRADRAQGRRVRDGGRGRVASRSAARELTIYDNVRRDGTRAWGDLCRGPHVPDHQAARQRLQADAQRRRLLARLGEEPAAAARLRHRVADQGRAQGLPRPAGRGREARPPQARRRARPVQLPRRARLGPGGLPPQGRRHQARDGGLRPPPAHRGGLPVRRHPAHQQGRAVPHLRAPAVLRRHHVPADGARGHRVPPQGDELPDAQPHLPLARALLPRAAAAPVRVRRRSTATRSPASCTA